MNSQIDTLIQTAEAVETYAEAHLFDGAGLIISSRYPGRTNLSCCWSIE